MNIGELAELGRHEPTLRFLVIGGYAVNAHGYGRATFDIDLLIPKSETEAWRQRLLGQGCRLFREGTNFIQFEQASGDPIDLMLVSDETFELFQASSEIRNVLSHSVAVPSLDHLLALKLHALKQEFRHRTFKDADDVETLVRLNKIDLATPHYEALFLKYGNRQIYETIKRTKNW